MSSCKNVIIMIWGSGEIRHSRFHRRTPFPTSPLLRLILSPPFVPFLAMCETFTLPYKSHKTHYPATIPTFFSKSFLYAPSISSSRYLMIFSLIYSHSPSSLSPCYMSQVPTFPLQPSPSLLSPLKQFLPMGYPKVKKHPFYILFPYLLH